MMKKIVSLIVTIVFIFTSFVQAAPINTYTLRVPASLISQGTTVGEITAQLAAEIPEAKLYVDILETDDKGRVKAFNIDGVEFCIDDKALREFFPWPVKMEKSFAAFGNALYQSHGDIAQIQKDVEADMYEGIISVNRVLVKRQPYLWFILAKGKSGETKPICIGHFKTGHLDVTLPTISADGLITKISPLDKDKIMQKILGIKPGERGYDAWNTYLDQATAKAKTSSAGRMTKLQIGSIGVLGTDTSKINVEQFLLRALGFDYLPTYEPVEDYAYFFKYGPKYLRDKMLYYRVKWHRETDAIKLTNLLQETVEGYLKKDTISALACSDTNNGIDALLFLKHPQPGHPPIQVFITVGEGKFLSGRIKVKFYIVQERILKPTDLLTRRDTLLKAARRGAEFIKQQSAKTSSAGTVKTGTDNRPSFYEGSPANFAEFRLLGDIRDTGLGLITDKLWHLQNALRLLPTVNKRSEFIREAVKNKGFTFDDRSFTLGEVISVIGRFPFHAQDEDLALLLLEYKNTNDIVAIDLSGSTPCYYYINKITNLRAFNSIVYREINMLARPDSEIPVKWSRAIEKLAHRVKSSPAPCCSLSERLINIGQYEKFFSKPVARQLWNLTIELTDEIIKKKTAALGKVEKKDVDKIISQSDKYPNIIPAAIGPILGSLTDGGAFQLGGAKGPDEYFILVEDEGIYKPTLLILSRFTCSSDAITVNNLKDFCSIRTGIGRYDIGGTIFRLKEKSLSAYEHFQNWLKQVEENSTADLVKTSSAGNIVIDTGISKITINEKLLIELAEKDTSGKIKAIITKLQGLNSEGSIENALCSLKDIEWGFTPQNYYTDISYFLLTEAKFAENAELTPVVGILVHKKYISRDEEPPIIGAIVNIEPQDHLVYFEESLPPPQSKPLFPRFVKGLQSTKTSAAGTIDVRQASRFYLGDNTPDRVTENILAAVRLTGIRVPEPSRNRPAYGGKIYPVLVLMKEPGYEDKLMLAIGPNETPGPDYTIYRSGSNWPGIPYSNPLSVSALEKVLKPENVILKHRSPEEQLKDLRAYISKELSAEAKTSSAGTTSAGKTKSAYEKLLASLIKSGWSIDDVTELVKDTRDKMAALIDGYTVIDSGSIDNLYNNVQNKDFLFSVWGGRRGQRKGTKTFNLHLRFKVLGGNSMLLRNIPIFLVDFGSGKEIAKTKTVQLSSTIAAAVFKNVIQGDYKFKVGEVDLDKLKQLYAKLAPPNTVLSKTSSAGSAEVGKIIDSVSAQLANFYSLSADKLDEKVLSGLKAELIAAREDLFKLGKLKVADNVIRSGFSQRLDAYCKIIEDAERTAPLSNALNEAVEATLKDRTDLKFHSFKELDMNLIGTVIIRPDIYPPVQQKLIRQLFTKSSDYRLTAIRKFGMNIVLEDEYVESQDKVPLMIAISDKPIEKAKDAYLLDVVVGEDGAIFTTAPIDKALILARGILLYLFVGKENADIEAKLATLYRNLTKGLHTLTHEELLEFITNGKFILLLPPEPVDMDKYDEALKLRLWTLIAA